MGRKFLKKFVCLIARLKNERMYLNAMYIRKMKVPNVTKKGKELK